MKARPIETDLTLWEVVVVLKWATAVTVTEAGTDVTVILSVVYCIGLTGYALATQRLVVVVVAPAVGAAVTTREVTASTIAIAAAASRIRLAGFDREVLMFGSSFSVTPRLVVPRNGKPRGLR
jgi:hypothetical protein